MLFKLALLTVLTLLVPTCASAKHPKSGMNVNVWKNNIPPRLQWNGNSGYCGEVCLISAGLYYGQYISQYDARAIATKNGDQSIQLLLGKNDQYAAAAMHLNCVEWNTDAEQNTNDFLAWVKQNVVKGFPVAIGIYTNEYLFYGSTNPNAGDPDYDHIVSVYGVDSAHALSDPQYYTDDAIYFSDNGLWGSASNPPYNFRYICGPFQASRRQANAKLGGVYSIANNASNYGLAITGVMDLNKDTLPVRVDTNVNYEKPAIKDGSNLRPASRPITLAITVSNLQSHTVYNLYHYNNLADVPNSNFNANAGKAKDHWTIQINSGNSYSLTQVINSSDMAIYRAVKATAP